jgi:predicted metal-binding protein
VAIDAGDILLDERAVLKCQVPRCANYGKLTCPPNSLAFTDFQRILSRYHSAIVLRVNNSGLGKPEDKSGLGNLSHIWQASQIEGDGSAQTGGLDDYLAVLKQGQEKMYDIMEHIESACLGMGYHFAAGLSSGGCSLCDECVGAGSPCRHPFRARLSTSGLGIDLVSTAEKAGIKLEFNQDNPSWTGIILVD